VQQSVDGAINRLSGLKGQSVFADFSLPTPDARRLAAVRFVDDQDASLCQNGSSVLAFTFPGSHVVHMCGSRFLGDGSNESSAGGSDGTSLHAEASSSYAEARSANPAARRRTTSSWD
jgi:hypothetical protein